MSGFGDRDWNGARESNQGFRISMADGPTNVHPSGDVTQTRVGLPPSAVGPIAQIIPGYEILGEIHRGGQGVVYLAFQKSTKRQVAIKIPRRAASAGAS